MNIFNYDPTNGAYLGQSVADENPLEPGEFILPAFATTIAPPSPADGNIRVFVDGAWGYVAVTAPDEPPSTDPVPPAPPSGDDVNVERDRRIAGGLVFDMVVYQSDADARENIAGASTAALGAMMGGAEAGDLRWADPDVDFAWIAADNTEIPMDAQTMFAFGQTAMRRKSALIFAAKAIKGLSPIPDDFDTNAAYWPA